MTPCFVSHCCSHVDRQVKLCTKAFTWIRLNEPATCLGPSGPTLPWYCQRSVYCNTSQIHFNSCCLDTLASAVHSSNHRLLFPMQSCLSEMPQKALRFCCTGGAQVAIQLLLLDCATSWYLAMKCPACKHFLCFRLPETLMQGMQPTAQSWTSPTTAVRTPLFLTGQLKLTNSESLAVDGLKLRSLARRCRKHKW
jgi:hypothetical protein